MGNWMTYQRVRNRNALLPRRSQREGFYPRAGDCRDGAVTIVGDLNRMEQDYLAPEYPEPPYALRVKGSDPATECSVAIGVPVDVVRAVLRYVFLEQP